MKTRLLVSILAQRRFLVAALVSLAAYVVLYLAAMQYLVIAPGGTERLLALELLPDWRSLAFRQRGPFLFEPIGVLQLAPLAIFLSIPNLAIALGLGLLVGANVAASYYGFHALGMRGLRGIHALIGTIPALISGAACCVPTLILVIGLQLTATVCRRLVLARSGERAVARHQPVVVAAPDGGRRRLRLPGAHMSGMVTLAIFQRHGFDAARKIGRFAEGSGICVAP